MQTEKQVIQKCQALAPKLVTYYEGFSGAEINLSLASEWRNILEQDPYDLSEAERIFQKVSSLAELRPPGLHDGTAWEELCIFIRLWYKILNDQGNMDSVIKIGPGKRDG